MMDNNLVSQFIAQINNAIDYKLSNLTLIKSAIVHSVNQDGTVNLSIPPNRTVYHNIQNQSIYLHLNPGDNVKVIVENGSLSNMWIIGGFKLNDRITADSQIMGLVDLNIIYPIGSIYISVNKADPAVLFGGKWELIYNEFLLTTTDKTQNLTIYTWKRIE